MTHTASPSSGNPALDAALAYAGLGLRVVPIEPGKKAPRLAAWQKAATTDRTTIENWWTNLYRDHGVGIALGELEDFATTVTYVFAVDIDGDSHGVDGEAAWTDACAGREVPETWEAITGGGGRHLLFSADTEVRNGKLADGVDIRGAGGQIVAEPTVHPSGQRYAWADGAAPWERPVAPAPAWLLDALQRPTEPPRAPQGPTADVGSRPGDLWAAQTPWSDLLGRDGWTYDSTGRDGEERWVRPGKDKRDGISATVNYRGSDVLKVFTSSVPNLAAEETYTKLGYLAATRHGGDYSAAASWLASQGYRTDELDGWVDVVAETPAADDPAAPEVTDEWPPLQPLVETPDLPPWPVHILPSWMADHIIETADQLQVPPDLCAQFALGAVAAAAMGHAEVVVGGRWREPLNLYLATALPSGGGKSPAEKAMTAPVRAWEKRKREASLEDVAEAEVRRKVLEAQARDAEKSAASGSRDIRHAIDARRLLDAHEAKHPFRRLVDDATPEKLTQILAEQQGLIAVLSTEAELLDMAAGTYGRSPNIAVYLKAYSGDTIMVDRKGSASSVATELRIEKPLLTVGLAMQPTVIDFIGEQNRQLEARGFLARFLFSCPTPTTGQRDRSRVLDAPDTTAADEYMARFSDLAGRWCWPAGDIRLTSEAERRFVSFLQAQEAEMGGTLAPVATWVAKLQSATLRVAGLLHLVDGHTVTELIDVPTIERAIEAANYWVAHALSMAVHAVPQAVVEDAHAIIETADRKGLTTVAPRALWLPMRARFRSIEEMVPALQHLEACGWVRLVEGAWVDIGVRGASVVLQVRPPSVRTVEEPSPRVEERAERAVWLKTVSTSSSSSSSSSSYSDPCHSARTARSPESELSTGDTPSRPQEDWL